MLTRHPRRTCPNRHAHMWQQYALQAAARDCFLLFPFPIAISYVYVSVRYTLFPQSVWRNNRCIFQLSSLNLFRGGGVGAVFSQLVGRSWGDHIHNIALPPPPSLIIKQNSVRRAFYISHVVCELSHFRRQILT